MTHEEISLRTKKALCASLKKQMMHKTFSKITVSELIRDCNVNRKTFYYHFQDIYDLLKWMLEQEAFDVVRQFDLMRNEQEVFNFIFDYVEQNSFILNCMYDSIGRDELKRFFFKDFIGVVENVIRSTEKSMQLVIPDEFRRFLCTLYTEGIAGLLIEMFHSPDLFGKEQLIDYMTAMTHNSIPAMIQEKGQPI